MLAGSEIGGEESQDDASEGLMQPVMGTAGQAHTLWLAGSSAASCRRAHSAAATRPDSSPLARMCTSCGNAPSFLQPGLSLLRSF